MIDRGTSIYGLPASHPDGLYEFTRRKLIYLRQSYPDNHSECSITCDKAIGIIEGFMSAWYGDCWQWGIRGVETAESLLEELPSVVQRVIDPVLFPPEIFGESEAE